MVATYNFGSVYIYKCVISNILYQSIYKTDHPDLTLSNIMEMSIGLHREN